MHRLSLPIVFLVLSILACGQAAPISTNTAQPLSTQQTPSKNPRFTIAVEYAILGVAPAYTAVGVSYAKVQDAFVLWGNIEPKPGQYNWGPLDALVREYQQANFSGLQMDLSALSPWASSKPPTLTDPGDAFPKQEYLDDYAAYVSAVVERYDGDGVGDMPGLLYPIHDYGIEREFTGFWPGSAEEYVRLLKIAYPAVKSADPQANVLLVALLMTDVFDGNPSQAEINRRSAQTPKYMRKSVPDIQTILAACDAYDIVDFHALGNYTEIPLTAAWIRDQLKADGCGSKPIWIGDAFPMSSLVGYGGFVPPIPFAPAALATRDSVVETLKSIADPAAQDHAAAQAWLYAETARGLTRKIVVSAGEGLLGINVGNLEDWKTGIPSVDKASVPLLGASMFMGMTDTTTTNQMPGGSLPFSGQEWSKSRRVGMLRPAYAALDLVIEKIAGFSSVEKMDLGTGIWAYQFETPAGLVWVLWYDDGKLYLPGQTPPSTTIQLAFPAASARLTWTPTQTGQSLPESQILAATNGVIPLTIDATPIFVEVKPGSGP